MLTGWTIFDWIFAPFIIVKNLWLGLAGHRSDPNAELIRIPAPIIAGVIISALFIISLRM